MSRWLEKQDFSLKRLSLWKTLSLCLGVYLLSSTLVLTATTRNRPCWQVEDHSLGSVRLISDGAASALVLDFVPLSEMYQWLCTDYVVRIDYPFCKRTSRLSEKLLRVMSLSIDCIRVATVFSVVTSFGYWWLWQFGAVSMSPLSSWPRIVSLRPFLAFRIVLIIARVTSLRSVLQSFHSVISIDQYWLVITDWLEFQWRKNLSSLQDIGRTLHALDLDYCASLSG